MSISDLHTIYSSDKTYKLRGIQNALLHAQPVAVVGSDSIGSISCGFVVDLLNKWSISSNLLHAVQVVTKLASRCRCV